MPHGGPFAVERGLAASRFRLGNLGSRRSTRGGSERGAARLGAGRTYRRIHYGYSSVVSIVPSMVQMLPLPTFRRVTPVNSIVA